MLVAGVVVRSLHSTPPFGLPVGDTTLVSLWNESEYDEVLRDRRANPCRATAGRRGPYLRRFCAVLHRVEFIETAAATTSTRRSSCSGKRCTRRVRPCCGARLCPGAKAYYHKRERLRGPGGPVHGAFARRGLRGSDSRTYLGMGYARWTVRAECRVVRARHRKR